MVNDPQKAASDEDEPESNPEGPAPIGDLPLTSGDPPKPFEHKKVSRGEATPVQGDNVSPIILPQGQPDRIVYLDQAECTAMFADLEARVSSARRVALSLDPSGAIGLPLLATDEETAYLEFDRRLSLSGILTRLLTFKNLTTFIFGASVETMLGLAADSGAISNQAERSFNSDYLAALGTRLYLDVAIVQSMREVRSSPELLQLLNRRRLGWLVDEICRQACLQIRLNMRTTGTVETVAFGSTGAVIGRARVEPGTFQL